MAVDSNHYEQSWHWNGLKPSRLDNEIVSLLEHWRKDVEVNFVQGGLLVTYYIIDQPCVIERVETTQIVAGGGAGGQNSIDLQKNGASLFTLATDGNTMLDNVAVGTHAFTYPTAGKVACNDLVERVRLAIGDVLLIQGVAGAAAYGTARTLVRLASERPAAAI